MSDIRAVPTVTGEFKQGDIADLFLKITDFDGTPTDPVSIEITITGPLEGPSEDIGEVVSDIPFQVDNGFYVYSWNIGSTQGIGKYRVDWVYVLDGGTPEEKTEVHYVVVTSDAATPPPLYADRVRAFTKALEHHICCAQSIPIYFEQAKKSRDRNKFDFTFSKWNQSAGVRIYRNQEIMNSGLEVDYFTGSVTFDDVLLPQDVINADYNFKWFSDEELNRFLANAVQTLNVFPPVSGYAIETVPDEYITIVLYGAARDALRQLMMCLQFQEPQQVFGGPDGAAKAFSNFETLKKNYENDFMKMLDMKKYGRYPTTRIIMTPEWTLPGGRCLSLSTEVLCMIDNSIFEDKIGNLFDLYKQYKSIYILSHSDRTGNMVFAPINYIWESGRKDVYKLRTKKGFEVLTSDEHLFFVNNEYIPLRHIKEGDEIITCDDHSVESDEVKSITKRKGKENMCDLEIFGTANLFANGIKCHNSRWFRMMFKS